MLHMCRRVLQSCSCAFLWRRRQGGTLQNSRSRTSTPRFPGGRLVGPSSSASFRQVECQQYVSQADVHLLLGGLHILGHRHECVYLALQNRPTSAHRAFVATSMAEEVHNPSINLPRAIVWSVPIGCLMGIAFILPINFTLPDTGVLLEGSCGNVVGF